MKLLKDIKDDLAGGITPKTLGGPRASRGPGLDKSDDDSDDDNMPDLETEEEAAERIALNKFIDKINNFDKMFKNFNMKLTKVEFNKSFKDKENKNSTK